MSFIDLLSNRLWTDDEITLRTEEMVHGITPKREELILMRKALGAQAGKWELTAIEQLDLERYETACLAAHAAGVAARADNALLQDVLTHEAAVQRLAQPAIDGDALDTLARNEAAGVIDAASPEVLELVAQRVAV